MSNPNQTISIKIAIDIPVDVAESTIEKLQLFAASLSQIPKQIEAPIEPLLSDDVTQAIKHVGEKAHAEIEAEKQKELDEEANKKMRQQQLADARTRYDLNVVQAYRLFRRIRPDCERDYEAYKAVSIHLDWPVNVAKSAVAYRKRIIRKYIKVRQGRTIMRLAYHDWTNKAIAKHLGLHEKTVAKIFCELRKGFKV